MIAGTVLNRSQDNAAMRRRTDGAPPRTNSCRSAPDPTTAADVQVLKAENLNLNGARLGRRVVVDATGISAPSLPWLARLVHLRRKLRAHGGDLLLAANSATARQLWTSGLVKVLPARDDVPTAVAALGAPVRDVGLQR